MNPIVGFTKKTLCSCNRDDFWSRDKNKAGMIAQISTSLTKMGCNVVVPQGNADVEIVKETAERSRESTTTFIGEDADFLIYFRSYVKTAIGT
ncbi:hypothetical protein DPMN_072317 [Dreissena polymorpha]|uniref:Uncharacterized protein n=1 Tax=Dreissena polymorpha TaxID=45954 RepID=A0A9D3Z684_DREPO|nr:hypothetical protein DPMN_072317 [Dreissena polymorpha]